MRSNSQGKWPRTSAINSPASTVSTWARSASMTSLGITARAALHVDVEAALRDFFLGETSEFADLLDDEDGEEGGEWIIAERIELAGVSPPLFDMRNESFVLLKASLEGRPRQKRGFSLNVWARPPTSFEKRGEPSLRASSLPSAPSSGSVPASRICRRISA